LADEAEAVFRVTAENRQIPPEEVGSGLVEDRAVDGSTL